MKLASKYNPIDNYRVLNNEVYKVFHDTLERVVFSTTPDYNYMHIKIQPNGIYHYELSEEEKSFYEEQYIHISQLHEYDDTPMGDSVRATEPEKRVLNFICDDGSGHRLFITGKKGWGKTTFIRNLMCNVIPKWNKTEKAKCTPVYLSFNTKIGEFEAAETIAQRGAIFYNELLNKIRRFCEYALKEDLSGDFYKWLLELDDFSEIRWKRDVIYKKCCDLLITPKERDQQCLDLRDELLAKRETLISAFSYLQYKNNNSSIPVIFLDDLDPLNISAQAYIYDEVYRLAHDFKIKVIVTMRPYSFDRVDRETCDAFRPRHDEMLMPQIELYLKNKMNLIGNVAKFYENKVDVCDKSIVLQDVNRYMNLYIDILLHKTSVDFLSGLSDGDLRIFNDLIHVYFSSGYIKGGDLLASLIKKNIHDEDEYPALPMWMLYSSIITNNCATVFGNHPGKTQEYVINILCNGARNINTYLIRLHLLAYFIRKQGQCKFAEILDRYQRIMPPEYLSNDVEKSVVRAVKRLANARLIGNNNRLKIPGKALDSVSGDDEFYIESLGKFYYFNIMRIFEYISFMKDDIDYPNNVEIQDCIQVTKHLDRLSEVVKYLEFLFEEERNFLRNLGCSQRREYVYEFSPLDEGKILFVHVLAHSMQKYAQGRKELIGMRINQEGGTTEELGLLDDIFARLDRLETQIKLFSEQLVNGYDCGI